jgi:ABC-type sugar transport system ATPase subunit
VRSDVNAILFDEPLTVIDPHMKWVLRSQLKQLHRQFGYTMVYVTHDQTEALTFADRSWSCMTARSCRSARRPNCSSGRATPSSAISSARRA